MPFVKPDRNKHQYIVGIDFGHGETSVAIARIDWNSSCDKLGKAIDVEFNGRSSMFSCFVQNKSDKNVVVVGNNAHKYAHIIDSATNDYKWDFYAYFKDTPSVLKKTGRLDIMKTFMKHVYEEVLSIKGDDGGPLTKDNHLVYIACPSSSKEWSESEVHEYAELASEAGLPLCHIDGFTNGIIRESRAAFICARSQPNMPVSDGILIVDFGSSTVDFTYYSSRLSKPIDDGKKLGAQQIEKLILDDISDSTPLVAELCKIDRIEKSLLLSIRQEKENYYNGDSVSDLVVNFNLKTLTGDPKAPKVSNFYSPEELESMVKMESYKNSILQAFIEFKSQYLANKQVFSIFLTGGASRMKWVKDIALAVFGRDVKLPKEIGDSSTTISRGIALAGRADVRTIMLESSLSGDISVPTDFSTDVITGAAENISTDAFTKIKNEVIVFKNSSTPVSIASLKSRIKSSLERMSLDDAVLSSYNSATRIRISDIILPRINQLIHEYSSPNVSISLQKTATLSGHELSNLSWSVDKVVEVCFEEVKDEIPTKVLKGLINTTATIVTATSNGLKFVGNIVSNMVSGEDEFDYDNLDDYWFEFTKPTTLLDSSQRSRVYDAFMAAESDIKSRIKIDIKYGNTQNVKNQIDKAYRKDVKSFMDSSIKEARLMLD